MDNRQESTDELYLRTCIYIYIIHIIFTYIIYLDYTWVCLETMDELDMFLLVQLVFNQLPLVPLFWKTTTAKFR